MFEKNNKYVTREIDSTLDIGMQLIIWQMIDELKASGKEVDYLQVFKIKRIEKEIKIEHSQEIPKYKRIYKIKNVGVRNDKEMKIFVIDDGKNSVMMLADEY